MWRIKGRNHCSDDLLIAYADGELSPREQSRVAAHLRECWECRGRMEQLDATAQALARMAAENPFGGAHRAACAKARFLEWKREFERQAAGRRNWFSRFPLPAVPALAALVALAISGALFWAVKLSERARPLETLDKARMFEQALLARPAVLHQVMHIEVLQTEPVVKRGGGRLELWAERGQRYSARWTDWNGELQYAVWHPSAGKAWRYDSRYARRALPASEQATTGVSLVEMEADRFEQLEAAVLDWVRRRSWRPVEVAGDFARYASQGGLALEARRSRTPEGRTSLLLTARRAGATMTVDLLLELDAETYRPRLQQATYRYQDRVLYVRVNVARQDPLPAAEVAAGVFGPDASLLISLPSRSRQIIPALMPPPVLPAGAADSPGAELEDMFTAHQLGSCIPPQPAPFPSGSSAFLHTAIRRQVEQRLAGVSSPLSAVAAAAEAVALAGAAVEEATELQRLAAWATSEKAMQLESRHWHMLDRMVQDHVLRLRQKLTRSRGLLEPLLATNGQASYPAPPHGQPQGTQELAADASHILSHLVRFEQRVRELFAAQSEVTIDPHQAIGEILLDLPTAEQELGWFGQSWAQAVRRGAQLAVR